MALPLHVLPRWHHKMTVAPARLHMWVTYDLFKGTKRFSQQLHLFLTSSSILRWWNHMRGTLGGARWRPGWPWAPRGTTNRPFCGEDGTLGSKSRNLGGGLSADGVEAVHKRMGERITQQENKVATGARNFVVTEDRISQRFHHSSAKSYWCTFQWEIQANDSVPAAKLRLAALEAKHCTRLRNNEVATNVKCKWKHRYLRYLQTPQPDKYTTHFQNKIHGMPQNVQTRGLAPMIHLLLKGPRRQNISLLHLNDCTDPITTTPTLLQTCKNILDTKEDRDEAVATAQPFACQVLWCHRNLFARLVAADQSLVPFTHTLEC